ncbi:MAG: hypothetical protein RLZZ584_2904 [Pseudomonadota bacterium]
MHVSQVVDHRLQGLHRGLQRCGEVGQPGALLPAQAHVAAQGAGAGQTQVACGELGGGGEVVPGLQTARMRQAGGEQVASQVQHLASAAVAAQELHTGFSELVGLVEHHRLDAGQQLGHAAVAQGQVGEIEVVVDDHDVGRHGLAPRQHDVALAELGAVTTQAVVARRGDQRDHGRTLVECIDLGQIAAHRGLGPLRDARQHANCSLVGELGLLACQLEAMQAQIGTATLEQGQACRHTQGCGQAWQVAAVELVLQALGGGADESAQAAEQHGHQVGIGLAHAGSGLDHQHVAVAQRRGDGIGHVDLAGAGAIGHIHARQLSARAEGGCNLGTQGLEVSHALHVAAREGGRPAPASPLQAMCSMSEMPDRQRGKCR